jgi:hypothetical protein
MEIRDQMLIRSKIWLIPVLFFFGLALNTYYQVALQAKKEKGSTDREVEANLQETTLAGKTVQSCLLNGHNRALLDGQ